MRRYKAQPKPDDKGQTLEDGVAHPNGGDERGKGEHGLSEYLREKAVRGGRRKKSFER